MYIFFNGSDRVTKKLKRERQSPHACATRKSRRRDEIAWSIEKYNKKGDEIFEGSPSFI